MCPRVLASFQDVVLNLRWFRKDTAILGDQKYYLAGLVPPLWDHGGPFRPLGGILVAMGEAKRTPSGL